MPTILQRYLGANIAEDIVKIYYNGEQVFPLDITVSPDTGALVFTAYVPSLDTTLNLDSGQVTFSGFAPSLDTAINTGFGAMTFTGYAPEIPTTTLLDGIVAYYNFDEASGNLLDQVGSADGTVTGATQNVTGKIGTAYSFDGVNDYVDFGNVFNFGDTDYSIACWVQIDAKAVDYRFIAKGRNALGGVSTSIEFYLGYSKSSDKLRFLISNQTSAQGINTTTTPNTGVWYHLVGVHSATDNEIRIYLNGTLEDSASTTVTPSASTGNFTIGAFDVLGTSPNYHDGSIDEAAIYNRALTADEITELYNSGTGKTHPFT